MLYHCWVSAENRARWGPLCPEAPEVAGLTEQPPEDTEECQAPYAEVCTSPPQRGLSSKAWGLIYKTLRRFHPKMYLHTKARFCLRTKVFRFIKPCVRQNLRKNPFINPSQGKIVRTCISTPSPPQNNHILSLQCLVILCITSSAYHFHAYSHPCDTMFNTVKDKRH